MSDDREAAFQQHVERQEPYFRTVRENEDIPWFEEGNPKRGETAAKLGLPDDVADIELRRELFFRRWLRHE
jgi:hypothetical protein